MKKIREIILRYKDILFYLIFGGLTTVINVVIYHVLYRVMGISNIGSTVIAWVFAVSFAFVTNKQFVFGSKLWNKSALKEVWQFFACRLGTGIVEIGMMFVFVDLMKFDGTIMKMITNIIVIIINYIASKLVIFKKR